MKGCLEPEEAFCRLQGHIRAYYQMYTAVYSGSPRELRMTARPRSFWKRPSKQKIHVPIAADLAATSSDLLFGEEVQITAVDEKENVDEAAQRRLEEIERINNLHALLCEAAESCSALGDVFLKVVWDREGARCPGLRVIQGDQAYPEYRMGTLSAIHIFTCLEERPDRVLRTYECYRPGSVDTALYLGSAESLGTKLGDDALAALDLAAHAPVEDGLMLACHVPNIRPNRMFRGSQMGRSDFDNLRDLMDALDETYSSWIRDIRLGKARLLVPAEYLRRSGEELFAGAGRTVPTFEFDEDVETLVAMDVDTDRGGNMITPSQFQIRSDDHQKTCRDLIEKIVSGAGYAPQTFGIGIEGMAQSGTALRIREKKSFSTTAKKQEYWQSPLEQLLGAMLQLDALLYPDRGCRRGLHVHVRFPPVIASDMGSMAGALQMLSQAGAVSTNVKVRMLHPDWTQDQVEEESERIRMEAEGSPK